MSVPQRDDEHPAPLRPSFLITPHECPQGTWQGIAAELFRERMLNTTELFPCIFGVDAVRNGTLRLAFIPAGDDRVPVLADALREFTTIAPSLGRRTSLVCIFEQDQMINSLDEYRQHFWWLLKELQELDKGDHPEGMSEDHDDPNWEFCYNSTPMFVVANCPRYVHRKSRYFEHLAVTFQPRFVFDDLKDGTPTGQRARTIIRQRLAAYDSVERTPLLGCFGVPGNREWTQYFLDDDNESFDDSARCPLATDE
jgi:FPC/CPF motif-containing protein YcgG